MPKMPTTTEIPETRRINRKAELLNENWSRLFILFHYIKEIEGNNVDDT